MDIHSTDVQIDTNYKRHLAGIPSGVRWYQIFASWGGLLIVGLVGLRCLYFIGIALFIAFDSSEPITMMSRTFLICQAILSLVQVLFLADARERLIKMRVKALFYLWSIVWIQLVLWVGKFIVLITESDVNTIMQADWGSVALVFAFIIPNLIYFEKRRFLLDRAVDLSEPNVIQTEMQKKLKNNRLIQILVLSMVCGAVVLCTFGAFFATGVKVF